MPGQRRRRWTVIGPALGQYIALAGLLCQVNHWDFLPIYPINGDRRRSLRLQRHFK